MIACTITFGFVGVAAAGDLNSAKQLFDRFESLEGPWNYGYPNDAGGIGWGEACVIRAYLGMYEATGDKAYLDKFVYHADELLKMRDSDRGVTDYRGLSLPAWRAGDTYTKGKGWYIYAVHTGMTVYPMADFARVVYNDSSLSAYKAKADIYLQAAKDAVAIHKSDFVNDGDAGYYRETPGSPAEFDGAPVPINQYLGMAKAELVLYQVTGDNLYLDHVTRMAKHFKSQLKVDPTTGAYVWDYWFGLGETGWTAAQNISINTPSYGGYIQFEDWSHGVIDVDFAALAYKAGIVFTADDMQKFGLTAKNMLKPDGSVAVIVNGVGTAANPELIGQWLRLYQYAPTLAPAVDRIDSALQAAMPGGFNGIAMLAQVYAGKMDYPISTNPPSPPPPVQPPQGEVMVNGDFSQGATGWNDVGGSIVNDSNGNKFRRQTSEQNFYQMVQVPAGDYTLNVATRKGTAASARIIVGFYDTTGKYTIGNDVTYQFKGTGWESVPAIPVKVPAGTAKVRITPFAVSDTNGTVDYDNVSFMAGTQPTNPPPGNIDTTAPTAQVTAPAANSVAKGFLSLSAQASDNVKVTGVTFEFSPTGGGQWVAAGPATETNGTWSVQWDTTKVAGGAYSVRAVAQDAAGNKGTSDAVAITIDNTKPVVGPSALGSYSLQKSGTLTVNYTLSENAIVTAAIYDSTGSLTRTLENGTSKTKGSQQLVWDGKNSAGTLVSPGTYTLKITAVDQAGNNSDPVTGTVQVMSDAELIVNGNFSQGATGWSDVGGSIVTESNGNQFRRQTSEQNFYQMVQLPAGDYTLNVATRKGTATKARIIVGFYDTAGKYTIGNDVTYQFKGTGWESVPAIPVKVPAGTAKVRITPFAVGSTNGTVDYDNVSFKAGTQPTNPPPADPVQLPQGEIMVNGDFSKGATGWSDVGGSIVTESNGNQFRRQTSEQNFYQMVQLPAGDYTLNVATRKGTATSARIIVGFYDTAGKYTIGNDVTYQFKGTGWESVPAIPVKVPTGTAKVRITPFAVGSTNGTVDYDNVSFKAGTQPTNPPPADPVHEMIINGDFSKGTTGWNNVGGSFKTDGAGNTYRSQTSDQNFYQMLNSIAAGQYALNLQTMRGTAAAPARIIVGYYTASGSYKILSDVTYQYKGGSWESVPEIVFTVPTDLYRLRITLFSGSSSIPVNFDNVSLKKK